MLSVALGLRVKYKAERKRKLSACDSRRRSRPVLSEEKLSQRSCEAMSVDCCGDRCELDLGESCCPWCCRKVVW